jgi:DNA gyrase subunit A
MLEENNQDNLPEAGDENKNEDIENADNTQEALIEGNQMDEAQELAQGISRREIINEMKDSYIDYAMSVIKQRALPDVRDGMKPVHRRILFSMHELGLGPSAKFKKSARVVGDVLGKYHPHGDSSVYGALVRMAQDFSLRYPLVTGQGNFGSIDGDNAAAMRYTEAKMAKISSELLSDIEKETVDFADNYDASQKEPTVLPAKLPFLLLNGVGGIAVGMATNIPPHNLGELVDGMIAYMEDPEISIEDLIEKIPGPDFPTGGTIYDYEEIKRAYATGRGKIVTRGKAEIEEYKNSKFRIIVTEIPYQVNKATLIERIADLVKEKKIQGISDLRDESDRNGMRIVVELKKDAYPKKILNQLYKMTQLQESFHVNMIALIGGVQPKLMGLKEILEHYLEHRKDVVTRKCQHELRLAEARAHILEGLKIALDNIDAVIETIKKSETKQVAHEQLMKKFSLSERQAQAILEMRLQQLSGLERKKIEDEYADKMALIGDLKDILAKPERVLAIIREDLITLKEKYSDERRTQIVPSSLSGFKNEDLIPNEPMIVTLTKGNYLKRLSPSTYKSQNRGGKGIIGMTTKEEDSIEQILVTNTHDNLLFFTNKGRVFKLKVYEVPVASRTAKGHAAVNIIQLMPNETVVTMVSLPKDVEKQGKYLLMATKNGTVKKTLLEDYKNVRKSGLIAIKIREEDELKWVRQTTGEQNIMLVTRQGQSIVFKETDARPMGRASMGVRGIKLKKENDEVVTMGVVKNDNDLVLTLTENGFGKYTGVSKYKVQNRGGSGIKTHAITKKTGVVVGARVIGNERDGDLIMMSEKGQVIRLALNSINISGRATQGVTVMRFKNQGDSLSCMALIDMKALETEDSKAAEEKKEEPAKLAI